MKVCCGTIMEDMGWKDNKGHFVRMHKCKTCGAVITRPPTPEEAEVFNG